MIRPGLKLGLLPGPCSSLGEGRRPLWNSGVPAEEHVGKAASVPNLPTLSPQQGLITPEESVGLQ